MNDCVLNSPPEERHTYFIAYYGRDFHTETAVLHVQHDFNISVQSLHSLIRDRIDSVLGEETPSCYHILALAAPEVIPA
jgi:hypothetical protein